MVRKLGERGINVPPGFATTASAYWEFVEANQLRDHIRAALTDLKRGKTSLAEAGGAIRRAFVRGDFPDDTADAIRAARTSFSGTLIIARRTRSSA
jgi:pyruvate,water dikinase